VSDLLGPDQRTAVAVRLTAARAETETRIAGLTRDFDAVVASSEGSNADDEHDPEGQTIGFERAQVSALLDRARRHLAEIDAAEQRLDDPTFGRCIGCGRAIPFERLLARPTTLCVGCAGSREGRARRR
jgi:DnaK suppressor protein